MIYETTHVFALLLFAVADSSDVLARLGLKAVALAQLWAGFLNCEPEPRVF